MCPSAAVVNGSHELIGRERAKVKCAITGVAGV